MSAFIPIPNQYAVLCGTKGVFQQAPLFVLENIVYAKIAAGFIRLYTNKCTSVPKLNWNYLTIPDQHLSRSETGCVLYTRDVDNAAHQ